MQRSQLDDLSWLDRFLVRQRQDQYLELIPPGYVVTYMQLDTGNALDWKTILLVFVAIYCNFYSSLLMLSQLLKF